MEEKGRKRGRGKRKMGKRRKRTGGKVFLFVQFFLILQLSLLFHFSFFSTFSSFYISFDLISSFHHLCLPSSPGFIPFDSFYVSSLRVSSLSTIFSTSFLSLLPPHSPFTLTQHHLPTIHVSLCHPLGFDICHGFVLCLFCNQHKLGTWRHVWP